MVAPALSSADLDAIGDELAVLRPDTCVISRPDPDALDAAGASTDAYEVIATLACRVDVAGTRAIERIFGGRFAAEADYVVFVHRRYAASVHSDYRIEVSGIMLEVVHDPSAASFEAELAIPCTSSR